MTHDTDTTGGKEWLGRIAEDGIARSTARLHRSLMRDTEGVMIDAIILKEAAGMLVQIDPDRLALLLHDAGVGDHRTLGDLLHTRDITSNEAGAARRVNERLLRDMKDHLVPDSSYWERERPDILQGAIWLRSQDPLPRQSRQGPRIREKD